MGTKEESNSIKSIPADGRTVKAEEIAKLIYAAMSWACGVPRPTSGIPAWLDHGNSLAQEEARAAALRVLSCLSTHTAIGVGSVDRIDLEAMLKPLDGYDKNQPGYQHRVGWNDAILYVMDVRRANVGVGPVGEAVAQFRTVGCSDWYDGLPDNEDGGGPYEVRTLYTRPVEEPGEVKRLTRERDEWKASSAMHEAAAAEGVRGIKALEEIDAAWDAFGTRGNRNVLTLAEQIASLDREVDTAEAALAETREALNRMVTLYEGEFDPETIPPRPDWLTAALTGDTQEKDNSNVA